MFIIFYEIEIAIFQTENGQEPFADWLERLDDDTKKYIIYGLTKVRLGKFGDHKYLGGGVSEFKFHFGSGYRIYFGTDEKKLIILLCGGDKRTQTSDIKKAKIIGGNMSKKTLKKFEELTSEHFKKNKKLAEEFLKLALEEYEKDGDEKTLLLALRQVAVARGGLTKLAAETGLSRENLYRALSSNGNPTFLTMKIVLQNLGYMLSFKRIRQIRQLRKVV